MPDRALSQEYPNYGYGIFLDISADLNKGRPNIAAFTLEGSEMVEGKVLGLGGEDGKTSGNVTSGVHASEYHLIGYGCGVIFVPYRSFIVKENVVID